MQAKRVLLVSLWCAMAQAQTVPVVEFYHPSLDHYFRTASSAEIAYVESGAAGVGWQRTHRDFLAWPDAATAPASAAPVCRFYGTPGRGPNSHFYTVDVGECAWVRSDPGWTYEGIAFYAVPASNGTCPSELQTVWRNYNQRAAQNDSNHRFSIDSATYQSMVAAGWAGEGVVMCGAKSSSLPGDSVAYTGSFPASTSGFAQVNLGLNGQNRAAWVYRPAAANPPLMLVFTGTGGTLESSLLDELGREGMQAFADAQGLAMIFPLPRTMTRGDWDNHDAGTPYWETAVAEGTTAAPSNDTDANPDLLFVRALIAESARAWSIDSKRVYSNGFSNGAFFSYFVANVLRERIAAFAETGGGLVLSNTTAGEPSACAPTAAPGERGAVRSCEASGWTPGTCSSSGAIPRPLVVPSSGRLPPAFLEANDDDDSVPFAHTCNLAASWPASAGKTVRIVHQAGGHIVNEGYFDRSWQFLRSFALP